MPVTEQIVQTESGATYRLVERLDDSMLAAVLFEDVKFNLELALISKAEAELRKVEMEIGKDLALELQLARWRCLVNAGKQGREEKVSSRLRDGMARLIAVVELLNAGQWQGVSKELDMALDDFPAGETLRLLQNLEFELDLRLAITKAVNLQEAAKFTEAAEEYQAARELLAEIVYRDALEPFIVNLRDEKVKCEHLAQAEAKLKEIQEKLAALVDAGDYAQAGVLYEQALPLAKGKAKVRQTLDMAFAPVPRLEVLHQARQREGISAEELLKLAQDLIARFPDHTAVWREVGQVVATLLPDLEQRAQETRFIEDIGDALNLGQTLQSLGKSAHLAQDILEQIQQAEANLSRKRDAYQQAHDLYEQGDALTRVKALLLASDADVELFCDERRSVARLIQASIQSPEEITRIEQILTKYESLQQEYETRRTAWEQSRVVWQEAEQVLEEYQNQQDEWKRIQAGIRVSVLISQYEQEKETRQDVELARASEMQGEWAKAVEVYDRLTERYPQDDRWREALKRVQEELWFANHYNKAANHVRQENWDQAHQTLTEIISRRADYRDAAAMLALVTLQIKGLPEPAKSELTPDDKIGARWPKSATLILFAGILVLVLAVYSTFTYGQSQMQGQATTAAIDAAARLAAQAATDEAKMVQQLTTQAATAEADVEQQLTTQASQAEIDAATRIAASLRTREAELRATSTFAPMTTETAVAQATATTAAWNAGPGRAVSLDSESSQRGQISPVGDEDWFKFTVSGQSAVVIETSGTQGDTIMWLYDDGDLNQIDADDDSGSGRFSRIGRVCGTDPLSAGTYYVKVIDYGNDDEIASYNVMLTVTSCR